MINFGDTFTRENKIDFSSYNYDDDISKLKLKLNKLQKDHIKSGKNVKEYNDKVNELSKDVSLNKTELISKIGIKQISNIDKNLEN